MSNLIVFHIISFFVFRRTIFLTTYLYKGGKGYDMMTRKGGVFISLENDHVIYDQPQTSLLLRSAQKVISSPIKHNL